MTDASISKISAVFVGLTLAFGGSAVAEQFKVEPNPGLIIEDVDDDLVASASQRTEEVVAITYLAPITQGDAAILGQSIATLIEGEPLFPPIEGLPDEVWKGQSCANCHQWDQANLCNQARVYLKPEKAAAVGKPHPYGGTFKANLKRWAQAGCP